MRQPAALHLRLAAWLALLAMALQFAAMPIAGAHMLQQALDKAGSHVITICTPQGSKQLLVGEDGQPTTKHLAAWVHCAFCLAAGSSPLQIGGPALDVHSGTLRPVIWTPVPAPPLSGAGLLWPWPHGPPRLIAA